MSKKMLKRSLALGALMAFVITGSAWAENSSEENETTRYGIEVNSGTHNCGNLVYNLTDSGDRSVGIHAHNNDVEVKADILSATVSNASFAAGVEATDGATVELGKATLTVSANEKLGSEAYGINVARKGSAIVTGNIEATVTGGAWVTGLEAYNGSSIEVGSSDVKVGNVALNVTANGTVGDEDGIRAHGILACGQTVSEDDEEAHGGSTITINTSKLTVSATSENGEAYSIYAEDSSEVNITSDTANITGDIYAGKNSVVNITVNELAKVNGNLVASDAGSVGMNLNGEGSAFRGSTNTNGNIKGVGLNLTSGATWYVTDNSTISSIIGDEFNVVSAKEDERVTVTVAGKHPDNMSDNYQKTVSNIDGVNLIIREDGDSKDGLHGNVVLNSNSDIEVKGTRHSIYVDNSNDNNNVSITADNLTLVNGGGYDAIRAENGGNVAVNANTINTTDKIYATNGGAIGIALGNVDAAFTKSTDNNLRPTFIGSTDNDSGNGEVVLSLNNGATWYVTSDSTVSKMRGDKYNVTAAKGVEDVSVTISGDADVFEDLGGSYPNTEMTLTGVDLNIIDPDGGGLESYVGNSNIIVSDSDVSGKFGEFAVYANVGKANISAENISFDGGLVDTEKYQDTIYVEKGGEVTLKANDKINLTSTYGKAINVIGGVVNLVASQADIKGDVYVSGESSQVSFNGTGIVNLTGSVSVENGATWSVSGPVNAKVLNFGENTKFVIKDGSVFETKKNNNDVFVINADGDGNRLSVDKGAKIIIGNGKVDQTYNIAKGFGKEAGFNWELQADNALWYVEWYRDNTPVNGITLHPLYATIKVKDSEALVESGVATNENKEILTNIAVAEKGKNPTVDVINDLASKENITVEQIQKGAAALLQIGEAGGFSGNVVSISKQVNGSVGARNSFTGPKHGGPRHRGGHGPSIVDENNGSAIWAQYVHGKDKVDGIDMGGVENAYESQFNGVVFGADFKQVGSYASGIAFNYGEGDSHSKKNVVQSDSEFDFWGVSYYGAVKKQDTNFIFDVGYSESDSDVEQKVLGSTITANPEASTWTAGVKVEKLIDKGAVQIVPYAGLRFMTIDTDEYEAKGGTASEATYYSTERQNIWLLPVGVSMSQENVYDSGWIVTPKADLSYTWAMGDTDSSMTVNIPNVGSDTLGYTVMDDGSFMATVGLDAQKEDWTFGLAYSYQKGDSTRSDRWYVNARYSF